MKLDATQDMDDEDKDIPDTKISVYDGFATINLTGPICSKTVEPVIEFIMDVNFDNKHRIGHINLFIDSVGGDASIAFKLIELMGISNVPIITFGWGTVSSAAFLIFMTGTARLISRNATVLSHPASATYYGWTVKSNDFAPMGREMDYMHRRLVEHYMSCGENDEKYVKKHLLTKSDVYLTSAEVLEHGYADGYIHDFKLEEFGVDNGEEIDDNVAPTEDGAVNEDQQTHDAGTETV